MGQCRAVHGVSEWKEWGKGTRNGGRIEGGKGERGREEAYYD